MHTKNQFVLILSVIFLTCLSACASSANQLPGGLTLEEHELLQPPSADTFGFQPVESTQTEILSQHAEERSKVKTFDYMLENNNPALQTTWNNGELIAVVANDVENPPQQIVRVSYNGRISSPHQPERRVPSFLFKDFGRMAIIGLWKSPCQRRMYGLVKSLLTANSSTSKRDTTKRLVFNYFPPSPSFSTNKMDKSDSHMMGRNLNFPTQAFHIINAAPNQLRIRSRLKTWSPFLPRKMRPGTT